MRASDVRAFLAARVPLLQLRYEDCVHNISACANAVARWTGQTEIAEPPGRDLATQKATSRHPSEYVSNWPQVVSQVCASNKAECAHLAAAGLAKAELACGAPAAGQSAARRRLRPVSVIELATRRTDARPHDVSDAECTITCEHAPNEELLCHLLPGLRPPSWRPPRALSAVSGEAQCAACLKAVGQPMRTLGTPRVVDSQVTLCPVMNPQFNCPRGDKWVPSRVSSSQGA